MGNIGNRAPVGVGVVITRGDFVLLGKRKGAHGAGKWALPGGKPMGGESPKAAAIREVKEETDITLRHLTTLPLWTYDVFKDAELHYVTLYFKAEAAPSDHAVTLEPEKCEGWEWKRPDDIYEEDYFVGTAEALMAADPDLIIDSRYDNLEDY